MAYAFNDDKSKFDLDETLDNVDNIAGSLATIEVSPAVTNHSTGEYIMYNNTLFQVTSPIATGENLVLGTNVSPINFGNEIKALQDLTLTKVNVQRRYWGPDIQFTMNNGTHALVMESNNVVSFLWRNGGGLEVRHIFGTADCTYTLNENLVTIRSNSGSNRTFTVFYVPETNPF